MSQETIKSKNHYFLIFITFSVNTATHTHTHSCTRTYTHTFKHAHTDTHTHTFKHTHTFMHTNTLKHAQVHTHGDVPMKTWHVKYQVLLKTTITKHIEIHVILQLNVGFFFLRRNLIFPDKRNLI
jgi:hypothetical protein